MKRVAVIGSTGQLGTDLVEVLEADGYEVFPLKHAQVDVKEPGSVRQALETIGPWAVVNCAAFVRVDECEDRPKEAFRVNAVGALSVARVCAELEATCVYIGTPGLSPGKGLLRILKMKRSELSGRLLARNAAQLHRPGRAHPCRMGRCPVYRARPGHGALGSLALAWIIA